MSKGATAGENNEPEQKPHHLQSLQIFPTAREICRHGNKRKENRKPGD